MLHRRRAELEKQLESMAVVGGRRVVRGGGSALKGTKVPPKYRSPSGDTWAGRGAKPRWLVAAIKRGRKLEDFLIDKSARKGADRSADLIRGSPMAHCPSRQGCRITKANPRCS